MPVEPTWDIDVFYNGNYLKYKFIWKFEMDVPIIKHILQGIIAEEIWDLHPPLGTTLGSHDCDRIFFFYIKDVHINLLGIIQHFLKIGP